MTFLDYIFCFFAGAILANVVPHFVHGISGDRFPTPFLDCSLTNLCSEIRVYTPTSRANS
jgi:hypothetical protein